MENSFQVRNKYTDVFFAFAKSEKADQLEREIRALNRRNQVSTQFQQLDSAASERRRVEKAQAQQERADALAATQPIDHQKLDLQACFLIGQVVVAVSDDDSNDDNRSEKEKQKNQVENKKPWLIFTTKSLAVAYNSYAAAFSCRLKLGGIYLSDNVYPYKDARLNYFV